MFILDKSNSLFWSGAERNNESIRIYIYSNLGSQAQTRTNMSTIKTGFDAQNQFLANVEDLIRNS